MTLQGQPGTLPELAQRLLGEPTTDPPLERGFGQHSEVNRATSFRRAEESCPGARG